MQEIYTTGSELRQAREAAGLSQTELAALAGLTDRGHVQKLERKAFNPNLKTSLALARAIGDAPAMEAAKAPEGADLATQAVWDGTADASGQVLRISGSGVATCDLVGERVSRSAVIFAAKAPEGSGLTAQAVWDGPADASGRPLRVGDFAACPMSGTLRFARVEEIEDTAPHLNGGSAFLLTVAVVFGHQVTISVWRYPATALKIEPGQMPADAARLLSEEKEES